MAYRLVYTEFWTDPRVLEEMTPEDKLFYLYLLTNPNTNMIGIYKITKKQMGFELGYSIESINSLMSRFEEHHQLIKYNAKTRELVIRKWGKYNLNKGGKPVLDCIRKDLRQVEDVTLINLMIDDVKSPLIRQLFQDRLSKYNNESSTNRDTSRGTTGAQYLIPNTQYLIPNTQYLIPNTNTTTTINNNIDNSKNDTKDGSCGSSNLEVFKHWEKCNFIMSPMLIEKIAADIEQFGAIEVMKAAEIADENGKHTYSYTKGIMEKRRVQGGNGSVSKDNGEDKRKWSGYRPPAPRISTETDTSDII